MLFITQGLMSIMIDKSQSLSFLPLCPKALHAQIPERIFHLQLFPVHPQLQNPLNKSTGKGYFAVKIGEWGVKGEMQL